MSFQSFDVRVLSAVQNDLSAGNGTDFLELLSGGQYGAAVLSLCLSNSDVIDHTGRLCQYDGSVYSTIAVFTLASGVGYAGVPPLDVVDTVLASNWIPLLIPSSTGLWIGLDVAVTADPFLVSVAGVGGLF